MTLGADGLTPAYCQYGKSILLTFLPVINAYA